MVNNDRPNPILVFKPIGDSVITEAFKFHWIPFDMVEIVE